MTLKAVLLTSVSLKTREGSWSKSTEERYIDVTWALK